MWRVEIGKGFDLILDDCEADDLHGALFMFSLHPLWQHLVMFHQQQHPLQVQKHGSVGRSIDITRYRGYDELQRMFGIDGQLEDPQRSDWKLVYVNHENGILLNGDYPWEEFVSCVHSIKILLAVEVQQMSLEGVLGGAPMQNESCSGFDNDNIWRCHSFTG